MKNTSCLHASLIILVFISSHISNAQISRNPDQSRPTSRIPRPADGGNISNRDRRNEDGNSKERKNTPPQINVPVNSKPEEPDQPVIDPPCAHPYKPPKHWPIEKPIIIQP